MDRMVGRAARREQPHNPINDGSGVQHVAKAVLRILPFHEGQKVPHRSVR